MAAFSPEPQTLLTVLALTVAGMPPKIPDWRAGACPSPAWTTFPMMTSSMSPGSMPARSTAALTAIAPSCVAGTLLNVPWNFPIGVRAAERITASFLAILPPLVNMGNYKANGLSIGLVSRSNQLICFFLGNL